MKAKLLKYALERYKRHKQGACNTSLEHCLESAEAMYKKSKYCYVISKGEKGWCSAQQVQPIFEKDEQDKNYTRVKTALDKLESKIIYYEDDKVWEKLRIIQKPKINKFSTTVEFEIQPKIWFAILSFSKGFRKFELQTAMNFESIYVCPCLLC